MQHARIYRAWLPSEIYSLLFSPILQHYHISERFQRATKRGKFSRAATGEHPCFATVLGTASFLSAFLTQGCDRRPIWGISVLVLRVQLTRATAVSPLILCEAGYKSQVQPANPQSHEISTECQKLQQKRTKRLQYNYITCYTKSLDRHDATHLPGK